MLKIENLNVSFNSKELLTDIDLHIKPGARHLLAGHNGSGKSTLAKTISGTPEYTITSGKIIFDERDITNENTTTRALLGIFMGAQHVPEIPGLSVISFLKHSAIAHHHFKTGQDLSMGEFLTNLDAARERLDIPRDWLNRAMNVGFSGGERKRLMLLHLILTAPRLAILDEPDSGADDNTKQLIAHIVNTMPNTTFLIISHQNDFTSQLNLTDTTTLSHGKIMIE